MAPWGKSLVSKNGGGGTRDSLKLRGKLRPVTGAVLRREASPGGLQNIAVFLVRLGLPWSDESSLTRNSEFDLKEETRNRGGSGKEKVADGDFKREKTKIKASQCQWPPSLPPLTDFILK